MPWRCYIGRRLGGAILMKSVAMSMAAHKSNRNRGNLPKTFITTILLALAIPSKLPLPHLL